MFKDPSFENSTEQDLIDVLERYPNVYVFKVLEGNQYRILEEVYNPEGHFDHHRLLRVREDVNRLSGHWNPSISYLISGYNMSQDIEFTPEGVVVKLVGSGGYWTLMDPSDGLEAIMLCKAGVEIMDTYMRLSKEERERIGDKYMDRVNCPVGQVGYSEENVIRRLKNIFDDMDLEKKD